MSSLTIPYYDEVDPSQIFPPDKVIKNFPVVLVNDLIDKINGTVVQATPGYTLLDVQRYSAPGATTWVRPEGVSAIRVTIVSGGGGGGGAGADATGVGAGGGGGSGATVVKFILAPPASLNLVVGAGGDGGTVAGAVGNAGSTGGTSSIIGTGVSLSASGGTGGAGMTAGTTAAFADSGAAGAASGDVPDLVVLGTPAEIGQRVSAALRSSGNGGSSPVGKGGDGGLTPTAASGFGAGGAGGFSSVNTAVAGLVGAGGFIQVEEFIEGQFASTNDAAQYAVAAALSAAAASNSASDAEASEINAAASATAAQDSQSAALVSQNSAATSATNANNSANSAATSAGTATTQAGIATTQAGIATTQAGIATTQATNAANSASAAANSAVAADTSADAADASADAAAAAVLQMQQSWRNRIINGDFAIDQRNAGALNTISSGASPGYGPDRFAGICGQAPGTFTLQREADTTYLGEFALKIATGTVDAALAAGDFYFVGQGIEGFNCRGFNWGNANAQTITISFTAWANAALTLPLCVRNAGGTRSWLGSFVVTTTPTQFTFTVPGDVTGTWEKENLEGINVRIGLGIGSTYQGVAGWQAGNFVTLAGMSNFMAAANTLRLKNFQVELGSVATEFERVQYSDQLARCQRYYQQYVGAGSQIMLSGYMIAAGTGRAAYSFPTPLRASPTVVKSGTWSVANCAQPTFNAGPDLFYGLTTVTALGAWTTYPSNATDSVTFSAEL